MKTPKTTIFKLSACLLASSLLTFSASAALTFNQIDSNSASVSFDPITFTATSISSDQSYIVFEDFFAPASTANGSAIAGSLLYSINGGTPTSASIDLTIQGQISRNATVMEDTDLIFGANNFSFTTGDVVTIEATDLIYAASDISTPISSGTVSAFLMGNLRTVDSNRVSVSVVPEPSSSLLLGLGMISLLARRKKTA